MCIFLFQEHACGGSVCASKIFPPYDVHVSFSRAHQKHKLQDLVYVAYNIAQVKHPPKTKIQLLTKLSNPPAPASRQRWSSSRI
jgi:hypothetical protein